MHFHLVSPKNLLANQPFHPLKVVATYYSVCHFWAQRILVYRHFENASKQVTSTCLGSGLKVRTIILLGCLPEFTSELAKRVKNDWKLLISAEFQMSLSVVFDPFSQSTVKLWWIYGNIMVLTFSSEPKQVLRTCFKAFSICLYINILWAQKWQTE